MSGPVVIKDFPLKIEEVLNVWGCSARFFLSRDVTR